MQNWLSKPKFILSITLTLCFIGALISPTLPISLYPNIDKPTVRITFTPTQDIGSFYKQWGKKIELSLKSIKDVENVEAFYRKNRARYFVNFEWDVIPETAKRDASAIASFYAAQLPNHLPPPQVAFFDPSSENYATITSTQYNNNELSELLKTHLRPKLDAIPGVANSMLSDRDVEYILIDINPYKLIEYDISFKEVLATLHFHEYDYKLGDIETEDNGKMEIALSSAFTDINKLGDIPLTVDDGIQFTLRDIASIKNATDTDRRFFYLDDNPTIAVAVWPKPDANLYAVSAGFQSVLAEIEEQFGEVVILNNPKKYIENAILNIIYALLTGMAASAIIVLIFYRKLSNALLICLTMPLALSIGLGIMHLLNVGINLLSLGGMSISIGLVIDSAVIVIDRIERIKSQMGTLNSYTLKTALVNGLKDVAPPLIISTATTLIVFIPLIFTQPLISSILSDIVLVTSAIIVASILLSLLFIPSIYLLLQDNQSPKSSSADTAKFDAKKNAQDTSSPSPITAFFDRFLRFCQRYKSIPLLLTIAIFSACIYSIHALYPLVEKEIVAKPKAEIIDVTVEFKGNDLSDERKIELLTPLREKLKHTLGSSIKYIYSDIRPGLAYLSLHLRSYEQLDSISQQLSNLLESNDTMDLSFEPWVTSALNVNEIPNLSVRFQSTNHELNRQISQQVHQYAKQNKTLIKRVKSLPAPGKIKKIHSELNPVTFSRLLDGLENRGITQELAQFIEYSAEPQKIYDIATTQGELPVRVGIDGKKSTIEQIADEPFKVDSAIVFINDLITFEEQKSWKEYYSIDGKVTHELRFWYQPNTANDAANNTTNTRQLFKQEIRRIAATTSGIEKFPIQFIDGEKEINKNLNSLYYALIASIVGVFLVLLFHFGDYFKSLFILSVIVFGLAGAMLSLYYFQSTLSVNSLLGMLILVGLSVNNSILVVDQYVQLKAQQDNVSAIINAVKLRLRSVTVTNMTTIVGMFPLAYGFGPGQDVLKPLGIAVCGGLLFATILTLVTIPLLLVLSEKAMPTEP